MNAPDAPADALSWTPPREFDEYKLVRMLGSGAMGQVYLARDTLLERHVAVKFISARVTSASIRRRFLVEARAAARVQHPNVIEIFRFGELDGHPYLITEFVRGKSLDKLPSPLSPERVYEIAIDLARGLAAAHRRGILHRDMKLANAIVDDHGKVKILDFGLAKLSDDPDARAPGESTPAEGLDAAAVLDASTFAAAMTVLIERTPVTPLVDRSRDAAQTRDGVIMGTPRYMAPELWVLQPATPRSDVYALGVMLYSLSCGQFPHDGDTPLALALRVQQEDAPPLRERAPTMDPRLAEIIDRALRREASERFESAEQMWLALEAIRVSPAHAPAPTINPYCGLRPFDDDRRALFFGRATEIEQVLEALRESSFVLVAGDSGVGKSSLCRAGVLPRVAEGALDPERAYRSVRVLPGRRPLASLLSALLDGDDEPAGGPGESIRSDDELIGRLITGAADDARADSLLAAIGDELDSALRRIRRRMRPGEGRLLFIDQLEELVTLADPDEAEVVGRLLGKIAYGVPGVRLLATVRGDYITRVTQLPGIGEEIAGALWLLSPLSKSETRATIVGPAQARGVVFESEALINELVAAGRGRRLPLLQFALAELWDARDPAAGVITERELAAIGGVSGALARHADKLLASLLPAQRVAARRILMRLVTADGTRVSLEKDDLVEGRDDSRIALESLVRGRLVAARDAFEGALYEIAHEALIDGWGTLRRWLERAHETRAIRERLEAAAREWNRLARDDDALWNAEQLADVVLLDPESLEPEHRAFLAASRARRRRRVLTRVALLAAAPLCALLVLIGLRLQLQRDLARRVDDHVARASAFEQQAQRLRGDVERARHGAFAEFDLMEPERGEALWDEASALSRALDETLRESGKALEAALSLDSQHPVVRELLAEHYYARAELADARHDEAEARALVERSELYDRDGARARRWRAPATVTITSDPPGAAVTLAAYETDEFGRMSLAPPRALGTTPIESLEIYPGSFVLMFRARGRVEVRHALALTRGETRTIETRVPAEGEVPEGFVFIPRGRFLTGSSSDDDLRRAFFAAAPLHPVETPAYLIARHETTYAEWIEFLDELSPQERELRIPQVEGSSFNKGVNLTPAARGEWRLVLSSTSQANAASKGEDFEYTAREYMRAQDWSAFPVSGVSYEDAVAYAAWLDRVGKVPGARLCSGLEWERAGRGADARRYPHGDRLDPDDANIDETYGKRLATMGPDEVGLHPRVQSPYGLEDMAGNVWEWTTSSRRRGEVAVRGGGFFHDRLAARLANLTILDPQLRDSSIGVRICASYSPPR